MAQRKSTKQNAVVPVRIPDSLLRKLDDVSKKNDRSRSYTVRQLLDWGLGDCEHGFIRVSCTKCNKGGKQ